VETQIPFGVKKQFQNQPHLASMMQHCTIRFGDARTSRATAEITY
jgi:hypothetical protein